MIGKFIKLRTDKCLAMCDCELYYCGPTMGSTHIKIDPEEFFLCMKVHRYKEQETYLEVLNEDGIRYEVMKSSFKVVDL